MRVEIVRISNHFICRIGCCYAAVLCSGKMCFAYYKRLEMCGVGTFHTGSKYFECSWLNFNVWLPLLLLFSFSIKKKRILLENLFWIRHALWFSKYHDS